jgi:hypothetical protein
LRWRADKLSVDSHFIHCVTFDDVVARLAWRIDTYGAAKPFEQERSRQSPAVSLQQQITEAARAEEEAFISQMEARKRADQTDQDAGSGR